MGETVELKTIGENRWELKTGVGTFLISLEGNALKIMAVEGAIVVFPYVSNMLLITQIPHGMSSKLAEWSRTKWVDEYRKSSP